MNLRDCRKEKGFALKDIAAAVKTTTVTLWRYENGKRKPSVKMAKRLAPFYGIPWTDFFKDVA